VANDRTITIERGERYFAQGDRMMFFKNDHELGVKNGTLGTVAEVSRDSVRVVLDGAERREASFNLHDYAALDYGSLPLCTRRRGRRSIAPAC
jgi:ATP-dependent exoDNAse (exonuclease V) alpha subunit